MRRAGQSSTAHDRTGQESSRICSEGRVVSRERGPGHSNIAETEHQKGGAGQQQKSSKGRAAAYWQGRAGQGSSRSRKATRLRQQHMGKEGQGRATAEKQRGEGSST